MQSNNNQRVNKYYVYGHYTIDTNQLFYIGVGTILNFKTKKHTQIYTRAYHFTNRTNYWKNVANKHGVKVIILSEFAERQDCLNEEKKLITKFGRKILGGLLCNLSEGGEIGPTGRVFKMSDEQKSKLSEIKSQTFYVYNSDGIYQKAIKTLKETAKFCGVVSNAISSCLNTKNYTNSYFVFRIFKGENLGYSVKDVNFQPLLSKSVITENIDGIKIIHKSLNDCAKYLKCNRTSVQGALNRNSKCKKHKVYLNEQSAAKTLSELS